MPLKKFIIEREIPNVGTLEREQLREAAAKSNEALRQLGPAIQWVESYVADDKTFCVYLANDETIIRQHAGLSGFPATKVSAVKRIIDPTTETRYCGPFQSKPPTLCQSTARWPLIAFSEITLGLETVMDTVILNSLRRIRFNSLYKIQNLFRKFVIALEQSKRQEAARIFRRYRHLIDDPESE